MGSAVVGATGSEGGTNELEGAAIRSVKYTSASSGLLSCALSAVRALYLGTCGSRGTLAGLFSKRPFGDITRSLRSLACSLTHLVVLCSPIALPLRPLLLNLLDRHESPPRPVLDLQQRLSHLERHPQRGREELGGEQLEGAVQRGGHLAEGVIVRLKWRGEVGRGRYRNRGRGRGDGRWEKDPFFRWGGYARVRK